ncbi:MAG: UDP-N-acetylglucosamine--N-acetylmuramyl-(pentapeptide) pyrophosphoryl-undecaprenol N-acetylglucosamine transferase [Candidatus Babeliales bacterium]
MNTKKPRIEHAQTIALVAGKSGGHIIPALTIAQQYKKKDPNTRLIFFTSQTHLDYTILSQYPFITHIPLPADQKPRFSRSFFKNVYYFLWSFWRSYTILKQQSVSLVISTGGYVSLPVSIGAYLARVPIALHELNAVPGIAAVYMAVLCTEIFVSFETSKKFFPTHKTKAHPYPLKFDKHKLISKDNAREQLSFDLQKKTVLVLGGSQGSIFLNTLVKDWVCAHPTLHSKIQVIHQTGHLDHNDFSTLYAQHGITAQVFTYHHAIETYYRAADIVVCRAGAGTLFESLFFEIPIITIPLEIDSTAHQVNNAQECARAHPERVTVLRQAQLAKDRSTFDQTMQSKLGL